MCFNMTQHKTRYKFKILVEAPINAGPRFTLTKPSQVVRGGSILSFPPLIKYVSKESP
jgi:hypothetical protein